MQTLLVHRVVHVFAADHPTASGHFPGNPVIPGACLLREVLAAVGGARLVGVDAVKFLRPVRPGAAVAIAWSAALPDMVRFTCTLDGTDEKVMTGLLRRAAS